MPLAESEQHLMLNSPALWKSVAYLLEFHNLLRHPALYHLHLKFFSDFSTNKDVRREAWKAEVTPIRRRSSTE